MSEEMQKALQDMESRIIAVVKQVVKQELNPVKREEKRYAKKLHNTELLLKNYKKFKKHADQAEFTVKNLIDDELLDMLGEDYEHDEQYIKSIIRTKERTARMLNHIVRVLEFHEYSTRDDSLQNRRAQVLILTYLENKTQKDIAKKLSISERTVGRDIEEGIVAVAPLMFGIDGVKLS